MPANKATRKYDLPRFKFGFPQLPSRRPGKTKVKAATTPGRIISERGDGPRPSRETLALELSFKFSIGATKAIALETSSCLGGFYAEPGVLRVSRATRAIHYVVLGGRRNRAGMVAHRHRHRTRLDALPLCGGYPGVFFVPCLSTRDGNPGKRGLQRRRSHRGARGGCAERRWQGFRSDWTRIA